MLNVNKYSIIGVVVRLLTLGGRIFDCWRPIVIYATLITVLSYIFEGAMMLYGAKSAGVLPQNWLTGSCSAIFLLIYTHLILAFVVDFYAEAFDKEHFVWRRLWLRDAEKWRSELFLLGYVAAYILPFGLAVKLLTQSANPDWRVEFVYFCIVFSVFVLILMLIRLFGAVSRYLQTKKSAWREVFKQTSGKAYVAVVLFLALLAIVLLSNMRLNIWLDLLPMISKWFGWLAQLLSNIVLLGFLALMIVFSRAQDELLGFEQE